MNEPVTCPLVDWYKFRKCDVTTCKNYTLETPHQCLELDRKKPEGTKQFSDAELNLYKFKHRSISTRLVQMYRKNAIQKVKAILILHKFIDWIAENYERRGKVTHKTLRRAERSYPLKIKRLGWRNWMWRYFLNDDVWQKFVEKSNGECEQFNQAQLLNMKLARYETLVRCIQPPRKGNTP